MGWGGRSRVFQCGQSGVLIFLWRTQRGNFFFKGSAGCLKIIVQKGKFPKKWNNFKDLNRYKKTKMTGRSLPTSVMAFIKSWQFDSLSKTNTHPYPTCLSQPALVVFYFCLCRLIAYEAINLVLAFSFILCTILICPTQA